MNPSSEEPEPPDAALLNRFRERGDEAAFAQLVRRHLAMVYSAAMRTLPHHQSDAEEIVQCVFAELARQSSRLERHPLLAGWLYITTYRMAANRRRRILRRRDQERLTADLPEIPMPTEPDWTQISPILDELMTELPDSERDAVVLRFFEQQEFSAIGRVLKVSDDAARMRVNRALDRLRSRLARRGITCGTAALSALLSTQAMQRPGIPLESAVIRAGIAAQAHLTRVPWFTALWRNHGLPLGAGLGLITLVTSSIIRFGHPPERSLPSGPMSDPSQPPVAEPRNRNVIPKPAVQRAGPEEPDALVQLRSALFDTRLSDQERYSRLKLSAGELVGQETSAIPLLQQALRSGVPEVTGFAVNATGMFGPILPEFHADLFWVLGQTESRELAGLIANRLSFGPSQSQDIDELLRWIELKPALAETLVWLVPEALYSDLERFQDRRETLGRMAEGSDPSVRDTAERILAGLQDQPAQPPGALAESIEAKLRSGDANAIRSALNLARQLPAVPPDLNGEIAGLAGTHPVPEIRLTARQILRKSDPNFDAIGCCPNPGDPPSLDARKPDTVSAAIGDLSAEAPKALVAAESLAQVPRSFWDSHPAERISATAMFDLLIRDPNPELVRAAAEGISELRTSAPKPVFTRDELQPLFDTMEGTLTPGEYRIAMRDLQSSLEQYWGMVGTLDGAKSLVPSQLVELLPVGPLHENPTAFEAMAKTLRQIDPRLRIPSREP